MSELKYCHNNFCSLGCQDEWFAKFGEMAVDHFGRTREPKRTDASGAWYKDYKYHHNNGNGTTYTHYFINDLLGERRPITKQQYDDTNLRTPPTV